MGRPDVWDGCYTGNWKGLIVPEAFSHPAKVSHTLSWKIYQHAINEGWVRAGDTVLDPFGGICGFGYFAMMNGLNWIGVELEPKFVSLSQQNIDLWNRKFRNWPNLGTARMIQGDSRRIREVVKEAGLIVGSPPFHSSLGADTDCQMSKRPDGSSFGSGKSMLNDYGHTPGNLANMKEGNISAVISSPPYAGLDEKTKGHGIKGAKGSIGHGCKADEAEYGTSPGQLGSMKEGEFLAIVSSPPYELCDNAKRHSEEYRKKFIAQEEAKYGKGHASNRFMQDKLIKVSSIGQLGMTSGDTFWQASKEIVQGCYDLLRPGGHAIWVCKDYVKSGKRVPFSDRWASLCESVGFKMVCWHQAILVENHGEQGNLTGGFDAIKTERKSFFRRLAEKKGSPRIDAEDVICMVKE